MHHTLLPAPERKNLQRAYRMRCAVVLCAMISVVGIIGIGALFPSYLRAALEERSELAMVASLRKQSEDSGTIRLESELSADMVLLRSLRNPTSPGRASDFIEDIVRARGSIRVTSFALSQPSTTTRVAVIQGIAPTRDALLAFKGRLEGLAANSMVELPVSELVQSKDIKFSLKIIQPII